MLRQIGITGGIGSGKTFVCRLFEWLGIPVYYADQRAKDLYIEVQEVREQVTALFGAEVYDSAGQLRREVLAKQVFNNAEKLHQLEGIIHPAVKKDFARWAERHKDKPYILKEAALLFESGSYKELAEVIVVTAPLETRIARVLARDATSREAVMSRIRNQWEESEKVALAQHVIVNDSTRLLMPQVVALHQRFS